MFDLPSTHLCGKALMCGRERKEKEHANYNDKHPSVMIFFSLRITFNKCTYRASQLQAQAGLDQVPAMPTMPTNKVKVRPEVTPLSGSCGVISLLLLLPKAEPYLGLSNVRKAGQGGGGICV